jgi:hypothetical protein
MLIMNIYKIKNLLTFFLTSFLITKSHQVFSIGLPITLGPATNSHIEFQTKDDPKKSVSFDASKDPIEINVDVDDHFRNFINNALNPSNSNYINKFKDILLGIQSTAKNEFYNSFMEILPNTDNIEIYADPEHSGSNKPYLIKPNDIKFDLFQAIKDSQRQKIQKRFNQIFIREAISKLNEEFSTPAQKELISEMMINSLKNLKEKTDKCTGLENADLNIESLIDPIFELLDEKNKKIDMSVGKDKLVEEFEKLKLKNEKSGLKFLSGLAKEFDEKTEPTIKELGKDINLMVTKLESNLPKATSPSPGVDLTGSGGDSKTKEIKSHKDPYDLSPDKPGIKDTNSFGVASHWTTWLMLASLRHTQPFTPFNIPGGFSSFYPGPFSPNNFSMFLNRW